jgi:periplasmic divalent cation tolerance protein
VLINTIQYKNITPQLDYNLAGFGYSIGGMHMENQYIVVFVTVPNVETGEMLANTLLEKKIVACVNFVSPITSFFSWQGAIERDEEVLLILKSRADLFESQLIPTVQSIHPYEVPEIIALPVLKGSADYLKWIDEVTLHD